MSEFVMDANEEASEWLAEAGYEPVVRCKDCAKSRVEEHTGDPERVCWKRRSHGEVVPDKGFCHDGAPRGEGE